MIDEIYMRWRRENEREIKRRTEGGGKWNKRAERRGKSEDERKNCIIKRKIK